MAGRLDAELRQALAGEFTPKFLGTLDGDGMPNCVPVISIMPFDDETLVFGEFLMQKSRRNLAENTKVGVAVLTQTFEAWSIRGTFLGFETEGPRVDLINNTPLLRYNAYTGVRAAGAIRIEEISPKRSMTKLGVLRAYACTQALAKICTARAKDRPGMPRPVLEKFARMAALRAAAFRDADGYPRTFGFMAGVPAGPRRLVLGDPLFAAYRAAIPEGAPIAVAVLTPDPIAYQVKGSFRRAPLGAGLVELAACYSASPPLLGERLDR